MAFAPNVKQHLRTNRRRYVPVIRPQALPMTNNVQVVPNTTTISVAVQRAYITSGVARLTAPKAVVSASADAAPNVAVLTAPKAAVVGYGGANGAVQLKTPTLSAAGTASVVGKANLVAPRWQLSTTATNPIRGNAALRFGPVTGVYSVVGYSGAICSVTISGVTVAASGTTGATGAIKAALPLYQLSAAGTNRGLSYANLISPKPTLGVYGVAWLMAPHARLTAIGSATVATTYEAYSVNLRHAPSMAQPVDEVTHYTNFPFDRIVRHNGSYFGVAADGLYLLEGTVDDDGTGHPADITWNFHTGDTDFDTAYRKTLVAVYFSGRLGSERVTIQASEVDTNRYNYPTPNTGTKNFRQLAGRGIQARYFSVGADGTGPLDIGDLDFQIHQLSRKI